MSKKAKKQKQRPSGSRTRAKKQHARARGKRTHSVQTPLKKTGDLYHIHSQSGLNSLLNSGRPTLVDFWAPWCAPCLRMGPVFEKVAARYGNRINFAKLNTEALPKLGSRFGVRSIPTIIAFSGRNEAKREIGVMNERRMRRFAESILPEEGEEVVEEDATEEEEPESTVENISKEDQPVTTLVDGKNGESHDPGTGQDPAMTPADIEKSEASIDIDSHGSKGFVQRIKRIFGRGKKTV
ncbi:MAG: thioredoxin fold domain-containing protein [Deltaproteobacteria bacterium]|nr:thioredoxin fold domain-containing protein [Deltaproteobacteria bacterium]